MSNIQPISTVVKLQVGNRRYPVTLTHTGTRIEFQFGFNRPLMEEIKAMAGAKWHGFETPPRKIWSVADCERNRFQLGWMQGENPYVWWDRPLQEFDYARELRLHQRDLCNAALTYHFHCFGAEMGLGKSLSAIEVMEKSGYADWWWCGPRSAIKAVARELEKWSATVRPTLMTYEELLKRVKNMDKDAVLPRGVVYDESSRIKNASAQRSQAAFILATKMREAYGYDCYVIEMSGTPSPKAPTDWWHQAEVLCPGFLREGSPSSFERRLGFFEQETNVIGQSFWKRTGWRDDERKCLQCGKYESGEAHDAITATVAGLEFHRFQPSVNEVALLHERLKGLVTVRLKKDCLDLPDKQYRIIRCQPKPSTLRASQTLLRTAPNAISGMTLLRELSDGFQYVETADGERTCPHCQGKTTVEEWYDPEETDRVFSSVDFLSADLTARLQKRDIRCPTCKGSGSIAKTVREARMVPCPKEAAFRDLLEECDESGRIVVFAGFTGAIDRCTEIAQKEEWTVVRVDGRGWHCMDSKGAQIRRDALELWADTESDTEETRRVAFIAHPGSGGLGLTLTESSMVVFYSNDFNPEYRAQAEDRIHRMGMDMNKGATIVDIIHLPTDERVLQILKDNRRLELMSLGEVADWAVVEDGNYDY